MSECGELVKLREAPLYCGDSHGACQGPLLLIAHTEDVEAQSLAFPQKPL